MNLLSIGASLGIVQAVFERGWLGGLFGIQPGPIDAFIPVLAFAIVFGLSMDYEVFLISRVHEEWQSPARRQRGSPRGPRTDRPRDHRRRRSDGRGVRRRSRSAATATLEMFGLAMASAVFLDALVIRMLLLPAVLAAARPHAPGRSRAGSTGGSRGSRSRPRPSRPTRPRPLARAGHRGGVMTDERTLDRLIAHLRAQVAELRRREEEGAAADESRSASG